jgi:uncharacterized repeat protein (TIGR03803 family)
LFFALLFAPSALASTATETVLYSFPGGVDGSNPYGGLVLDSSGNLYGTTGEGGNSVNCNLGSGCGTVFMLVAPTGSSATWTQSVLYSFQGATSGDGGDSTAGLAISGTTLYGTTSLGGQSGQGTVFEVIP